MIPGHSHEPTGAGGFGGQQEAGLGQQSGLEHGGHGREALAGAGAGAGAAGLGASALHHHHQGVLPATFRCAIPPSNVIGALTALCCEGQWTALLKRRSMAA